MLEGILLFFEYLDVDLILLQTDLSLDDADHLVHVLVLAHPLSVYLLALLEDLLELGLIGVFDGVPVVLGPVGEVALLVLGGQGLRLAPLRPVERVEGAVADSDFWFWDGSVEEFGGLVEDGVDVLEVAGTVVFGIIIDE